MHPSAWKGNSQKMVCRMPYSPARLLPYGRPEISRLLKVNHYMLLLRIKMRLGGCVASSQNDDADTGGGVVRRFGPGSCMRGTARLTSVCIQAVYTSRFKGRYIRSGREARRDQVLRL